LGWQLAVKFSQEVGSIHATDLFLTSVKGLYTKHNPVSLLSEPPSSLHGLLLQIDQTTFAEIFFFVIFNTQAHQVNNFPGFMVYATHFVSAQVHGVDVLLG
jgi:hypothetical protein